MTPSNDNDILYVIFDKEGKTILERDTEEEALYAYQQWAEENAACDGEHYEWSEKVEIVGYNADGDAVYRIERLAIMDSRGDGYDHGRFDYESTRL